MIENQYEAYLRKIYRKSDGTPLAESSVKHYGVEAIRKISEIIREKSNNLYDTVYDISSIDELLKWKNVLFNDSEFKEVDNRGRRMYSAGFNRYAEFAKGYGFKNIDEKIELLDVPIPVKDKTITCDKKVATRNRILVLQSEEACSYKCQINPTHETFIVASTDKQYVEGHHIIPLSMQNQFSNNLDCYANILILCPTCHRLMHYGRSCDKARYIDALYEERSERYSHSGLDISHKDFVSLVDVNRPTTKYFY